jgi:hypothetical protein
MKTKSNKLNMPRKTEY